ncbi:ssl0750 [Synechocystis sp. PCC 6803]|uniref:Ssl0750 protein n=2 Tax=Synechocystis TaxID=1142 RepID=P74792_SYNY3|nr:hypothetical protein MYO_124500 [Synechocystis sp. PCC 6803]AVP90448.1 hypothetical protein C7I86_12680 [Synechocystis sp. IPPAS B-1465]MBD2616809.1 hypothetical protein [Synechocystis sp. FACHB-898]MBD2638123.1 hypothetical protein [Synechocystis sp. FACHB-908]MBD2659527.1 hypothetical protein [Synechocystis sp. FACHB-929]BAL30171.1 hypothetical protein SYNGTI_2424 [Synechocystis sp. PCC 6803 substr. GT-I]BAL33340.1 hypothetical protein SYNPCCN_2423 [Synechocystis sp. PCC 6803 substr. PCC
MMLFAFFQPLEFPDNFNQTLAINVYAETICGSQAVLEVARGQASQAAMDAFNRHRQLHLFPMLLLDTIGKNTEAELLKSWDEFSRQVCPEKFE